MFCAFEEPLPDEELSCSFMFGRRLPQCASSSERHPHFHSMSDTCTVAEGGNTFTDSDKDNYSSSEFPVGKEWIGFPQGLGGLNSFLKPHWKAPLIWTCKIPDPFMAPQNCGICRCCPEGKSVAGFFFFLGLIMMWRDVTHASDVASTQLTTGPLTSSKCHFKEWGNRPQWGPQLEPALRKSLELKHYCPHRRKQPHYSFFNCALLCKNHTRPHLSLLSCSGNSWNLRFLSFIRGQCCQLFPSQFA